MVINIHIQKVKGHSIQNLEWKQTDGHMDGRSQLHYLPRYYNNIQQHSFNSFFSRTTWEAQMMGWQWHQLDHMQVIYTMLQTDNHASTSSLHFYKPDALLAAQSTASKH